MQVTYNTVGTHHVQYAMCHVVRRVEIAFTLALVYWLKQFTDEGKEETGIPGENT